MAKKTKLSSIDDYLPYSEARTKLDQIRHDADDAADNLAELREQFQRQTSPEFAVEYLQSAVQTKLVSPGEIEAAQRRATVLNQAAELAKKDVARERQNAETAIRQTVADQHAAMGQAIIERAAEICDLMDQALGLERSVGGFGAPLRPVVDPDFARACKAYLHTHQK